MVTRRVVAAVALLCMPIALVAQQARDTGAQPPRRGTAQIAGVIVSNDAPSQPIRRAIVTLTGDLPGGRSVVSDDEGRFAFAQLPAGRFTIAATKPAYLPAVYGTTRPGRPGTAISIADGQNQTITIQMARGAVVSGAVRDRNGQPLPGLQITVIDLAADNPNAPPPADPAVTDDRGIYRIFGLPPGDYAITVTPRLVGSGETGAPTVATMDATLAELTRRNGSAAPGPSPAPGQSPSSPAPMPPQPPVGYVPMYYPGTPLLRDATHIRLAASEERLGLDFQLNPIPVCTITGTVSGVQSFTGVQISITPEGMRSVSSSNTNPTLSQPPDAQGRFVFTNVAPGIYRIVARLNRASAASSADQLRAAAAPGADNVYAAADVEMLGQDAAGISLALQPGSALSGRVKFDAASHPAPADLTTVRIGTSLATGTSVLMMGSTIVGNMLSSVPAVPLKADGTFEIKNIAPDVFQLQTTLPPDITKDWWLRSAIVNGRDLLDAPLRFQPGVNYSDVVVTLTDRHTELSGRLETSSGAPATDYFIVVLPADRVLWDAGGRRVRSARPASDGLFSFADLPPGEYRLAALTDVVPTQLRQPEWLTEVAAAGAPVTITEGGKVRQDLRIK